MPWNEALLARWRSVTDEHGTPWDQREALVAEIGTHLGAPRMSAREVDQATDLINCLLSIVAGHPVGSRQSNLVEVLNTFLAVDRRHRFARLVRRFTELCGRQDALASGSVKAKFANAMSATQDGRASAAGRLALGLFPEVFARQGTDIGNAKVA